MAVPYCPPRCDDSFRFGRKQAPGLLTASSSHNSLWDLRQSSEGSRLPGGLPYDLAARSRQLWWILERDEMIKTSLSPRIWGAGPRPGEGLDLVQPHGSRFWLPRTCSIGPWPRRQSYQDRRKQSGTGSQLIVEYRLGTYILYRQILSCVFKSINHITYE